MSSPRARERKPPWLRQFIPKSSPLVVTVCEGCGLYIIQDRESVWESWDCGLVEGDDLTVAIILGRPLTRVTWLPSVGYPLLRSVSGSAGIRPDGQYLAGHTCHLARGERQTVHAAEKRPSAGQTVGRAETVETGDSRIQTHLEYAIQPAQT